MEREVIKKKFIEQLTDCKDEDIIEVRKLTPTEALRLQGMREDDIQRLIDARISVTELYQLAGNSIAIPCLQNLFEKITGKETVNKGHHYENNDICNDIVQIDNLIESKSGRTNPNAYRVYSVDGVCPTLMASMGCGGRSPLIVKKNGEYI